MKAGTFNSVALGWSVCHARDMTRRRIDISAVQEKVDWGRILREEEPLPRPNGGLRRVVSVECYAKNHVVQVYLERLSGITQHTQSCGECRKTPMQGDRIECRGCGEYFPRSFYLDNSEGHLNKRKGVHRRFCGPEGNNCDKTFLANRNLKQTLGISLEDKRQLVVSQGGKCAICQKRFGQDLSEIHTDHDHETGKVRGALCAHCNTRISILEDEQLILAAMDYLEKWRKKHNDPKNDTSPAHPG